MKLQASTVMYFPKDEFINQNVKYKAKKFYEIPLTSVDRWIKRGAIVATEEFLKEKNLTVVVSKPVDPTVPYVENDIPENIEDPKEEKKEKEDPPKSDKAPVAPAHQGNKSNKKKNQ